MEQTTEWNIICRICLQEGKMRSVFENDDDNIRICDKIMCCSNVKIHKNANFPENICRKCLEYLRIAYKFRKDCENSDAVLQSFTRNNQFIINENENLMCVKPNNSVIKRIPLKTNNLLSSQKIEERKPNISKNDIKFETRNIKIELNNDSQNSNSNFIHNDIEIISKTEVNYDVEKGSVYVDFDYQDNYINDDDKSEEIYAISGPEVQEIYYNIDSSNNNDDISQETIEFLLLEGEQKETLVPVIIKKQFKRVSITNKNKMKKTSSQLKKSHICELCGNVYKQRHALDVHMRRHRNEKPFICEICKKSFVLNVELKSHMRTHTGQKPYGCKFCGRHFADFGSRVKHERIHTGERPYVCGTCGKGFAYSYGLNSHILTHTGEKPHECLKCGRRFTKKHHLKHHLNVHVKKELALQKKREILNVTMSKDDNNLKNKNILNENNENVEILEEYIGDNGSENIIENEEVGEFLDEFYYLTDGNLEGN